MKSKGCLMFNILKIKKAMKSVLLVYDTTSSGYLVLKILRATKASKLQLRLGQFSKVRACRNLVSKLSGILI